MKPETAKIIYADYCRKSSEDKDRQILSIQSQIDWGREISGRLKLKILKVLIEEKSAEMPEQRPIFKELIGLIKNGKINGIVCWKLDRLARNPEEAGIILGMLKRSEIQHIVTNEREYRPEDNAIISYIDFGMADQYVRDLSRNVKRGLKDKLQLGWYPSRAPLGYLNTVSRGKGANEIIKDPQRFDIVRQMWQLMLTRNYTPPQILEIVNKDWLFKVRATKRFIEKSLSRSQIYKIFTNPFYYGWFDYGKPKQLYKGGHEPMITEEEFDRVQVLLGRKGKPRPKKHQFAFTGLMRCGSCGAMVTAEEKIKRQKNGNVHHYIYYHCTKRINPNCTEKAIEVKELNKQIDQMLVGLNISEKFKYWAIQYLHEIRQDEAQCQETVLENKQRASVGVTKQLDNLLLKYTSLENAEGQLISDQEYQTLKTRLLKEKIALESELQAQGGAIEEWVELSEKTFNFARYAQIWFAKGDMETKRAIFACLGSHLLLKDQKLAISLHKPFQFIFENKNSVEKELSRVRTSENATNKRQIAQVWAKCPILRWVEDSNLCGAF